jgi:hypothetical protein
MIISEVVDKSFSGGQNRSVEVPVVGHSTNQNCQCNGINHKNNTDRPCRSSAKNLYQCLELLYTVSLSDHEYSIPAAVCRSVTWVGEGEFAAPVNVAMVMRAGRIYTSSLLPCYLDVA